MKKKTIVITGGNAGIGAATVNALVKENHQVFMLCRNMQKATTFSQGKKGITIISCDLASLSSVQKAAKEVIAQTEQIDVLINNAGLIMNAFQKTNEGFEMQFGVNHLAHFLLTQLLLEQVRKSEAGRIVNVSSAAHYRGKIIFDSFKNKMGAYRAMKAYSQSKLCNVLFTRQLAKLLQDTPIKSNCLHPGVVRTSIGNKSNWLFSLGWNVIKLFGISPNKGAQTSLFLALSEEVKTSGSYYDEHQKERKPSSIALDDKLAEDLWKYSMDEVQDFLIPSAQV